MSEEQKENKGQEPLEVPANDRETISYKQEVEMPDETVLRPTLFSAWKRWKDFKGRSCRKEYWFFVLSYNLISISLLSCYIITVWGALTIWGTMDNVFDWGDWIMLLICIPILLVLLVSSLVLFYLPIPLTVRRLHDIGLSGYWYFLIIFVPIALQLWNLLDTDAALAVTIIAWIWSFVQLVVLGFIDSQKGTNKYGDNPKWEEVVQRRFAIKARNKNVKI